MKNIVNLFKFVFYVKSTNKTIFFLKNTPLTYDQCSTQVIKLPEQVSEISVYVLSFIFINNTILQINMIVQASPLPETMS